MLGMSTENARTGRLGRWEARQQAKFDRKRAKEPARTALYEARNVRVKSPRGRQYVVRAVKRGDWLVMDVVNGSGTLSGAIELGVASARFLVWLPRAVRRWLRRNQGAQWTVGVIRYGGVVFDEAVVWKEHLPVGTDETVRVAELAEQVRLGTLDVRTRLAPMRKV
jgi:hypothetical protein